MILLTKEGKIIIVVILCLIAVAIGIPSDSEEIENNSARLTQAAENVDLNKKSLTQESNKSLEIKGLKIADENHKIKNPFIFSYETRDEKAVKSDMKPKIQHESTPEILHNDSTKIKNQKIDEMNNYKAKAEWKLTGVVIVGDSKTAILSYEKETQILSLGDSFDDKIITDIDENYILYNSASGQGRLDLLLP